MKRHFLKTPYGQLHYSVEGSGKPVILLHQGPFSSKEYDEVIPVLAKDYKVITVDTLGYGQSDKPPKQPSVENYAETIKALLDELDLNQATIVGHHTGAFIACEVGAAYPERVENLVLSGIICTDESLRKIGLDQFKTPWQIKEDGSHITDQWNYFREHDPSLTPEILNRMVSDWLQSGTPYSSWGYIAVFSYKIENRLSLIQCPTLLLFGTADLITWGFPEEHEQKVKKAIQRSKIVHIEGGTYAVAAMMPKKFAQHILDFIKNPEV